MFSRIMTALLAATGAGLFLVPAVRTADDLDDLQEKAVKEAVQSVRPYVVKIETSGGTDVVKSGAGGRGLRTGTGPTTGLIVHADGYVVSSAFNFANKPATIRVSLPGSKERKVAHVVATDQTRMLTLLKLAGLPKGTKLPVPEAEPKAEVKVGHTAVAVGRTFAAESDSPPSVSVGIISAVNRIWGKMLQTDAKVSPTNYGGPLVALDGRVYGVLVPASPQAEGETAGFEWYDSGIGFAVPLEDVYAVLPRMMKGTEKKPVVLRRGYLGVTMRNPDMYGAAPVIGTVSAGSAAEKAGLKPGDLIKEVAGKPVRNYAQVLHLLGSRYEGDTVALKLTRGGKEVKLDKLTLGSAISAFGPAFLGVLPVRDDPAPGVEVRYVYAKGPADSAGIKAGDRIMKVGLAGAGGPPRPGGPRPGPRPGPVPLPGAMTPITRGRDQLMQMLETAGRPGAEVKVEVKRKGGKTETLTVKLGEMPDSVPEKLPENSTAKKALTPPGGKPPAGAPKKVETGTLKRTTPAADHTYWVYVPDDYDPNISYGVVIWLHPVGKNKERDIEDFVSIWGPYCDANNLILLCPRSDNARGWTTGEADFVQQALQAVMRDYTVDRRRVVAHGMGLGGEVAFYLGFQARPLIRGVATVAAQMGSNPRAREANRPLSFFLVVGGKDPLKPAVAKTKEKLAEYKYPVILREVGPMGHEYIDSKAGLPTLEQLVRWVDSLDRL